MKASLLYFTVFRLVKKGDYGSEWLTNCDRSLQFEGLWEQKQNPALWLGDGFLFVFTKMMLKEEAIQYIHFTHPPFLVQGHRLLPWPE